jgi:hypothetical protein
LLYTHTLYYVLLQDGESQLATSAATSSNGASSWSNFYTILVGYAVIAAVATPVLLYYLVKYVKLKGGFEAAFGANAANAAAPAINAAAAAANAGNANANAAAAAANAGNANANAGGAAAAAVPGNAVNQGNNSMSYAL